MRTPIYAALITTALTLPVWAESSVALTYGEYQADISAALEKLSIIDGIMVEIEREYPDISTAPFGAQARLTNQAIEMIATIDEMQVRSKEAFEKIEHEYELFCLPNPNFLFLCAQPQLYYKRIIIDTIVFGGVYEDYRERSISVITVLDQ